MIHWIHVKLNFILNEINRLKQFYFLACNLLVLFLKPKQFKKKLDPLRFNAKQKG